MLNCVVYVITDYDTKQRRCMHDVHTCFVCVHVYLARGGLFACSSSMAVVVVYGYRAQCGT
jgi:hypothetical protein